MKEKMYRFIFSILFIAICFTSKGQIIDGKLYTIFNNWYQWSGGKFNTNLNIPKVIATTGRDTGGIRYSLSDSSMYIWTGSQWRAVGSAIDTTSLSNRINLRVKYSDTASMLGPYLRKIDTLTLSNRINLKQNLITLSTTGTTGAATFNQSTGALNIPNYSTDTTSLSNRIDARVKYSDTASMLSPYLRSINLPNTDTAIVVKAYVTNSESFTITKGQIVYIFGAQGDRASVKLAKNTSDTFSSKTLGIVRADIASGQAGWITTQGQVSGINLGAYTAGDILWLDSIAGGFTKTKPEAPYHSVFLGVVERANAGNGLIYVKPQNGVELDELHNVKITSPSNNQILAYTISTGIWQNKSVITALGYTPLNVTDTASMISPYARTNVVNAGLATKLNISDTAAMLSVYQRNLLPYRAISTTYNALTTDYVIHCTSGTFTINLPSAVGIQGEVFIIKNSGSGFITLDPNGSQTIDGSTTYTMSQAETVRIISTGANWITL